MYPRPDKSRQAFEEAFQQMEIDSAAHTRLSAGVSNTVTLSETAEKHYKTYTFIIIVNQWSDNYGQCNMLLVW
ncbi:hypothetical protein PAT3040_01957 [Paenibacillus agaridevorans]|uniref:Uncharacterized protein n=1 Tax=Paenibacillus agaridevorans TaxID=171404 RepID=A0A2R5ELI3_9BACL|nr:hypothetical protein PAT3040_01957 [Paenibacillus agaridevorans]